MASNMQSQVSIARVALVLSECHVHSQKLGKPLVLPRECGPQVSSTTCGIASIGVACSELVACEEISIATKTSMF